MTSTNQHPGSCYENVGENIIVEELRKQTKQQKIKIAEDAKNLFKQILVEAFNLENNIDCNKVVEDEREVLIGVGIGEEFNKRSL